MRQNTFVAILGKSILGKVRKVWFHGGGDDWLIFSG